MVRLEVVSFDLDGTLIHPAVFNAAADALGFGEPLQGTFDAYLRGELSIPEAFELDYAHFVGRSVTELRRALALSDRWTPGTGRAVARLKDAGVRVIVTTDQPRFLAEATLDFGVDEVVCSEACVAGDAVTADVTPRFEKWPNLAAWLEREGVPARRVAHVGNGTNDVPVFEKVGVGVAVNFESGAVARAARHAFPRLRDLNDVADVLLRPSE